MWRLRLRESIWRAVACRGSSPESISEFFFWSLSGRRLEPTLPSAMKSPVRWSSRMRSAVVEPVGSHMRAAVSSRITFWSASMVALAARALRSPSS